MTWYTRVIISSAISNESGIILCLASIKNIAINKAHTLNKKSRVNKGTDWFMIYIHTKQTPINNSTKNILLGIAVLQNLHFPRKTIYEIIGTKSYHFNCFLHDSQIERLFKKNVREGILSIKTFTKLPTHTPNIKNRL